jgi:transposase InsO family protein
MPYALVENLMTTEPRAMIENYRQEYNKNKPRSSLNYLAPESFILFTQSLPMQLVQKYGV